MFILICKVKVEINFLNKLCDFFVFIIDFLLKENKYSYQYNNGKVRIYVKMYFYNKLCMFLNVFYLLFNIIINIMIKVICLIMVRQENSVEIKYELYFKSVIF